jgi:hypothetical protein
MKLFAKLLILGTAFGILSISALAQLRIIQPIPAATTFR